MEDVRLIAIPFNDSLSIRRNWKDIRQLYPDIINYFPDYDPEYMSSRKIFGRYLQAFTMKMQRQ